MTTAAEDTKMLYEPTITMLRQLRMSTHRLGYKYLTVAVPMYANDDGRSLTKEIYPDVARHFGGVNRCSVEQSIRMVILDAWERRDPAAWEVYFPGQQKAPSNKQFLAVLAERLRYAAPGKK